MIVLYVDDDRDDVELFTEALSEIALEVECLWAENGKRALEILDNILPDYIFLDINMPVMNGRQTLAAIRNDGRFHHIPVIILSTVLAGNEAQELQRAGAEKCFTKPNSLTALCEQLASVFE